MQPPGPGPNDAPVVLAHQVACFASFNGVSSPIRLSRACSPRILHENALQGAGDVLVRPARGEIVLEDVRLDRFRRKQVVQFERAVDAQFTLERSATGWKLAARPGVRDEFGLLAARRIAGFARIGARLYRVRIAGARLVADPEPDPLSWHGVLPESLVRASGIPFVRWLLGHETPAATPVLCVLLEGARPLHDDAAYLSRRDIVQLLILPLAVP